MSLKCLISLLGLCALLVVSLAKITVTCIGDSITQGGTKCAEGSYTDDLKALLGPGFEVVNAGASGKTQLKLGLCSPPPATEVCSYRETDAWQRALASKADVFTIMLGTNDAKAYNWQGVQYDSGDSFALDYVDMVGDLFRLDPPPKAVFLMVSPPLYQNASGIYPLRMDPHVINDVFPSLIPDIARVASLPTVINVQAAILASPLEPSALSCDGCHPTPQANAIIAAAIAPRILEAAKGW